MEFEIDLTSEGPSEVSEDAGAVTLDRFDALGAELSNILRNGHLAAEAERARAQEVAAALLEAAQAEASRIRSEAATEAAEQVSLANGLRSDAKAAVGEAYDRASTMIANAQAERMGLLAEIDRDRARAHATIASVIAELQDALVRLASNLERDDLAIPVELAEPDDEPSSGLGETDPVAGAVRSAISRMIAPRAASGNCEN